MTKDSGHSKGKGGGGQQPPNIPRKNNVLPIDRGRVQGKRSWPLLASGVSLNSGAGLLIVIGVLCGLLISESERKSLFVNPNPEDHPKAGLATPGGPTQGAASPTALAKPSPAIRAGAVQPGASVPADQPANRAPNPVRSYTPAKFQATHKKVFGGCTGELELTSTGLRFRCPKSELDFPVNAIASANKDGVVLKSGEKYHFAIANYTKDQAEAIFITWLSRVQTAGQQNSAF